MAITVYGIANCDQVKKARQWLTEHKLPFTFHDFRVQGLDSALLDSWLSHLPWDALINKRGTTWRQLDKASQLAVTDAAAARALALQYPTLIKRPVIQWDQDLLIGFNPSTLATQLDK